MLVASGDSIKKAAKTLGVHTKTISFWKARNIDLWDQQMEISVEKIVTAVRAAAGTDAILENPDRFLTLAKAADKWCDIRGLRRVP